MNRQRNVLILVAALLALTAGIGIGRWTKSTHAAATAPAARQESRRPLYYRNPMGLSDTSPVPKKDSMGMDYIPVYAEDAATAAPGTVTLTPERVQMLGVRTEPVRLQHMPDGLRVSGTIRFDETRQLAIAPRFDGWVDTLAANQTGLPVKQGQTLLTVYSPQLLAAQEDYRVADTALHQFGGGDPASRQAMQSLRDAARRRLLNFGISETQLTHLAHRPPGNLAITAPADGVIVDKPVVAGMRFAAGETILRLADLSTVWVVVDVPATRIDSVRLGQRTVFTTPALPGREFEGRVGFLQPTLNATTRTLGVRVALPNPNGQLRPGLFGQVMLVGDAGKPVLTIPRSALIDSGTRQIVLVQVAEGRFAPRTVAIGRRGESAIEVTSGLAEGERVVVEGNFLIDAESNLRAALADLADPGAPDAAPSESAIHAPEQAADSNSNPHGGHAMTRPESPPAGSSAPNPNAVHDMHNMPGMEH